MSTISTGTVSTTTSSTSVSGTVSGLDTSSLIQNAVDANNEAADNLDLDIEENDLLIAGYEELYGLAEAIQESLETLKSVTSLSGEDESVFSMKSGTMSSTGADATSLMTVTIDDDAKVGSYDLVVDQKATEMVVQSSSIDSHDEALGYIGEFIIGLDGGSSASISITEDMSLEDIAEAINDESESSGVEASLLKVSEDSYQLILEGTQTNQEIVVSTTLDSGMIDVLQTLGLTDGSDAFLADQISQKAQPSILYYNSTEITRDDNSYDDLIDGVSIDIANAEPDTVITLEINNDTSSAKEAIETLLSAYSDFRDFVILNQTVDSDGAADEDATLFSDRLMEMMSSTLSSLIAGTSFDDDAIQTIGDLGLALDEDNKLVIDDETVLDDALLNNFESVMNFFSTETVIDSTQLRITKNETTATSMDFELEITLDEEGDIASVNVSGQGAMFEINGTRLVGKEGTEYEGLTLTYIGDEDATINVSLTAGIADLIYNAIEPYTDTADGLIQNEIDVLESDNDDMEERAEDIRERGEEIREQETERYSKMEAELAVAESLLSTIQALLGIDDD